MRSFILLLLVAGPLSQSLIQAAQSNDPELEKVFADWDRRRERIQTIRYRVKGERTYLKRHFNDPIDEFYAKKRLPDNPPRDITGRVQIMLLLDLVKNRHRIETDEQFYHNLAEQWYDEATIRFYDGSTLRGKRLKYTNPHADKESRDPPVDISILKGDMSYAGFGSTYNPFFLGHGTLCYDNVYAKAGKLAFKPETDMFTVYGKGLYQGRPCLIVRTRPRKTTATVYDEFWVDQSLESAVVRQMRIVNGEPQYDIDVRYGNTPKGLPSSWTYSSYNDGRISLVVRLVVESAMINPVISESEFRFAEEPGMLVRERVAPAPKPGVVYKQEKKHFRIGNGGQRIEVSFRDGVERRRSSLWPWVLGFLTLLAGGLWLAWKRKQYKRSPDSGGLP